MTTDRVEPGRFHSAVTARDLLTLIVVIVGLLVVTGLPYLFAYASAPPEKQFMGILLDVPDTAQYLSWARESSRALLIENKLTAERGDPMFFNLFWLSVGRLARALGLGLAEAMQLVRPLAGAVYLGAVYWFITLMGGNRLHRWVSFLIIACGGGLGWVLVVLKQGTGELAFPLDVYVMEANTFLTVMAFPLQAISGGLLVLALGVSLLAFERNNLSLAIVAGLLSLVLGLQHGYDLLIIYAVLGAVALTLAFRQRPDLRPIGLYTVVCALSLPALAYLVYITRESPIFRAVLSQYGNAGVYTPPLIHLPVLMGLPLLTILVSPAQPSEGQRGDPREVLLACWLVVGFLLLYIPTDFQIKMLSGWQVPVGILSTRVLLSHIAPAISKVGRVARGRPDLVLGILFVLAVLPVNVYLYLWRFVDLARHDYPYYLHHDEIAAMRWLEANSQPSDVVLSSLTIGQYLPSVSGNTAFLAHWAQTLDFYRKMDMVASFFDPASSEQDRLNLIQRFGVSYIFHGHQEEALGGYDPSQSPYLRKVYSSARASLYRVQETVQGVGVNR